MDFLNNYWAMIVAVLPAIAYVCRYFAKKTTNERIQMALSTVASIAETAVKSIEQESPAMAGDMKKDKAKRLINLSLAGKYDLLNKVVDMKQLVNSEIECAVFDMKNG